MKKLIVISVIVICVVIALISINITKKDEIPDGYIAVFNGGSGEITFSTYIYKIDNGKPNYGFEYINTTNITKHWGSSELNVAVTGKGKLDWTDDVFEVAKNNHAYSSVTLSNNNKVYTIEEFRNIFLMN